MRIYHQMKSKKKPKSAFRKSYIEEKIENGEVDLDNKDNGYLARLQNIYTELSLIQKILAGTGLFFLLDEIFADDDSARIPDIAITNATVNESDNNTSLTVSLSNPFDQEIKLNYVTQDGTAVAGSDYESASGSVTFAIGETSKSINIAIANDGIYEDQESFTVSISLASNSLGNQSLGNITSGTGSVNINDDDPAPVFGITGASANEDAGTVTLTITRENSSQMDVSVDYLASDDSAVAGQDYDAASGTVTFSPNETEKTISIAIIDDALDENEESFVVTLSNASHGNIQENAAIVTITDNDGAPSVSISGNNNVSEDQNMTISVTLTSESGKSVSIDLETTDVQAIAGQDFQALNETITFAPGETSKSVSVTLIDDTLDEDNEVFSVIALNPVNTFITSSESAPNGVLGVLIEDNDEASEVILPENFSVSEDVGTTSVNFALNRASGKTISLTMKPIAMHLTKAMSLSQGLLLLLQAKSQKL